MTRKGPQWVLATGLGTKDAIPPRTAARGQTPGSSPSVKRILHIWEEKKLRQPPFISSTYLRCIIVIKAWCNYCSLWQVVKDSITALQSQVTEQQCFPPKACSHPHPKAKTCRKWNKLNPFCFVTVCVSLKGRQKSQEREQKDLVCNLKKHRGPAAENNWERRAWGTAGWPQWQMVCKSQKSQKSDVPSCLTDTKGWLQSGELLCAKVVPAQQH